MRVVLAALLTMVAASAACADSFWASMFQGSMTAYTSSGPAANARIYDGKVTSTTSGTWVVDLSTMGCSTLPTLSVQAISPDATLANSSTATITALSVTAVGGNVFQPNTIALGGTPYKLAAVAMPVHVIAICR